MKILLKRLQQYGVWRFIRFSLAELKLRLIHRLLLGSYSQKKEDLVLDRLTGRKKSGFYVDIGAYDPGWFSNTLRFYKRGWRGINIEPDTTHWMRFQDQRPRDTNLNLGAGTKRGNMTFYRMDPPTLSTFSKERAEESAKEGFTIEAAIPVSILPLKDIFSRHARGKIIDFLSLDVEGMEMDVLRSNNWRTFRPRFLCIEMSSGRQQTLMVYLEKLGYAFVSDNGLNAFF